MINERLEEYPNLRAHFLEQLRHPTWVLARTLDELDHAITQSLRRHSVRFVREKTWNDEPTPQCLNCQSTFAELCDGLRSGEKEFWPRPDGTVPEFCQYLRLFLRYTHQFIPRAGGAEVIEIHKDDDVGSYPLEALTSDGRGLRGENALLVDGVDTYCAAPDVHEANSCFYRQEVEAAGVTVEALKEQGLPVVLSCVVEEREGIGEFAWRQPQREGAKCAPETCVYANDAPPGFIVVAGPGDIREMVCICEKCGVAAQEALIDWEKREREEEDQRCQAALSGLRQLSVERTLVVPSDKAINLTLRSLLEAIEPVLVPDWDTQTMFHVVLGWQAAKRTQIAAESGITDPTNRQVSRAFLDRYGVLAKAPKNGTILGAFAALQEKMTQSNESLARWVACLALVRTWRDEVKTTEQVEKAARRVADYE